MRRRNSASEVKQLQSYRLIQMDASLTCKYPLALTRNALNIGWDLLTSTKHRWKKNGRSIGSGWHELKTNTSAGFHASCYGLKLIANRSFPANKHKKQTLVEDVSRLVKHTIEFDTDKASSPEQQNHFLEAQNSTIKVANFIAACAAVGRNPNLRRTFRKLQPSGRKMVEKFLDHKQDGKWGHWLAKPTTMPQPDSRFTSGADVYYPSATVYDAFYRFGKVDKLTRVRTHRMLRRYARDIVSEFLWLFDEYGENPPIKELWKRLPALRTVAILDQAFFSSREATPANFERIFNSYIRNALFSFELNHTDDFQKFEGDKPLGTDYVSFNTTACLCRAIIGAVRTKKISPIFCEWVAPFLCKASEQFAHDQLPQPERFSYIHQTYSCLLAAAKLQKESRCIPKRIRMEIFPRVFSQHTFRKVDLQGFYVTPFGLGNSDDEEERQKEADKVFKHFKVACAEFNPAIKLVRGDHAPLGVITDRIWRYLNESRFIIAVCAGANPNVYYEIGIADTLGKPVLLVGRSKHRDKDFRFDIQGITSAALNKFEPKTISPRVKRFLKHVYGGESL